MAADEGRIQRPRNSGSGGRGADGSARNDAGGHAQNHAGYVITKPRQNKDGTVELDGSLIADAARMAGDLK